MDCAVHVGAGPMVFPGSGRRTAGGGDGPQVRHCGVRFGERGAILWQHLFWFFGHPEVYILALPFFGITSEVLPVFSRKPIFGYKGLLRDASHRRSVDGSVGVDHMYVTGAVLLPFFAFMTMLIAVPTG